MTAEVNGSSSVKSRRLTQDEMSQIRDAKPTVLTPREVAAFLSIGRDKTYRMLAAGEIPSVRLGRTYRTPRRALEEWLARQAAKSLST